MILFYFVNVYDVSFSKKSQSFQFLKRTRERKVRARLGFLPGNLTSETRKY